MLKIYGAPLSPFVRKTLLALELKEVEYELDPVFPGSDDPAFRRMSPLGKIPALAHDDFTISDSSIICRYLDRAFPDTPVYPSDPQAEARATWIEEYCDTRLMDGCGGLFQQKFMFPKLMNRPTDEAAVENILANILPPAVDYIESITPESGPMVGEGISIADIAVVTCFAQAQYGEYEVDGARYPRLRRYLDGAFAHDIVRNRLESEKQMLEG
jgi:glutathione S-transferase